MFVVEDNKVQRTGVFVVLETDKTTVKEGIIEVVPIWKFLLEVD